MNENDKVLELDLAKVKKAIDETGIELISGMFTSNKEGKYCGCALTALYCHMNNIKLDSQTARDMGNKVFDYFTAQGLTDVQIWSFIHGVDGNKFTEAEEYRSYYNLGSAIRLIYKLK